MDLFKLVGSIFIDTDAANDSLAKTDKKAQDTGKTFKDIAGKAAKVGTAVVGAAGAAVGGMFSMAKQSSSTMDVIDKASKRMRVSTDTYQELAHAANLSGVEMTTLEKAAKNVQGLDMSMDEALAQIYELGTAEERAALAAELFGEKAAYEMAPLLNASGEEMNAMRQEAHDLGLVFDETSVKAGATLDDAIGNVTDSLTAMGTNLGASIMPLVTDLMDFIMENLPLIQGMFDLLAPALQQMFSEIMPPVMDLARQLLPVILNLITTLLPPMTQIIRSLLPIITQFMSAFMPVFVQLAQTVLPVVLSLIQALTPVIQTIANVIRTGLGAAINFVMPIIRTLGSVFTTVFNGIRNVAKSVLNGLIGFINTLINGLNIFLAPLRAVIAGVSKLIGKNTSFADIRIPNIPYLAKGGDVTGGTAIVGEDGPELLNLNGNGSARVTPLNDNNNAFVAMKEKLDAIIDLLRDGFGLSLDGRQVARILAGPMNEELGALSSADRRAFA